MNRLFGAALALVFTSTSLGGCATVIRGTKESAQFESSPNGATVTAESISEDRLGPFTCVTPCELELKRKRTWDVEFSLEGFQSVSGLLKPQVTGGGVASGAGNVIAGGIIGIGVDAGTGANLDLRPNPMIAELEPTGSGVPSRIVDKNGVSVGQRIDENIEAAPERVEEIGDAVQATAEDIEDALDGDRDVDQSE